MKHVVVTSINPPTGAVKAIAEGATRHDWRFVVIGDRKSPPDFDHPGVDYFDLQAQADTGFAFAQAAPTGHYARKNVGYLLAMRDGAESLLETDDDNLPIDDRFWAERPLRRRAPTVEAERWVNIYSYFTEHPIWPRGLPLDEVRTPPPPLESLPVREVDCPVQQGLANANPDVDAIYRLALPLPIDFERPGEVITSGGAWCPFNSQNTLWFPQAYPLLYLPFHCSFRMTDIWRSFVVQRILYANGWGVLFHEPTVYQDRNEHDLMKDFADEVVGYLNNREIRRRLNELQLGGRPDTMLDDMEVCYGALIDMGLVGVEERPLLAAWRHDVERTAVGASADRTSRL